MPLDKALILIDLSRARVLLSGFPSPQFQPSFYSSAIDPQIPRDHPDCLALLLTGDNLAHHIDTQHPLPR
jgi:hypothetical protein